MVNTLVQPPQPRLREGFQIVSGWELVRGRVPEQAVHPEALDPHVGWICWIGKSGATPLPLHALSSTTQEEIDRLAFNACRRIDQALGLPVPK